MGRACGDGAGGADLLGRDGRGLCARVGRGSEAGHGGAGVHALSVAEAAVAEGAAAPDEDGGFSGGDREAGALEGRVREWYGVRGILRDGLVGEIQDAGGAISGTEDYVSVAGGDAGVELGYPVQMPEYMKINQRLDCITQSL